MAANVPEPEEEEDEPLALTLWRVALRPTRCGAG